MSEHVVLTVGEQIELMTMLGDAAEDYLSLRKNARNRAEWDLWEARAKRAQVLEDRVNVAITGGLLSTKTETLIAELEGERDRALDDAAYWKSEISTRTVD